jgi:polyisoprenoid-binding protein YceI
MSNQDITSTPVSGMAGTWTVDPSHSSVGFVVRHMMVSKVRGRFTDYDADVVIDEDPARSKVSATVQMASIDTNDKSRDEHLRSGEFFDVENHPTMTFEATGVSGSGSNYELAGELTVRGVTKPVVFDVEFHGVGKNPWGATVAGFSATSTISREQFGLSWNQALETGGFLVGDKVNLELEIEANKYEQPAS